MSILFTIKPPVWNNTITKSSIDNKCIHIPDGWLGVAHNTSGAIIIFGYIDSQYVERTGFNTIEEAKSECERIYYEQIQKYLNEVRIDILPVERK